MVRRGVCVCAHDNERGRVCAGVVSTSSSTATLRGKESPGDILGTDHERQPSTNQLEELDWLHVCACVCMCVHVCMCMCAHVCACLFVCACVCVFGKFIPWQACVRMCLTLVQQISASAKIKLAPVLQPSCQWTPQPPRSKDNEIWPIF